MNHFTLSAVLASIASIVAAAYIWLLNPASRANRIFALYWFSIGFWTFFVGTQSRTIPMLSGFWWGWLLHLGCTFIPVLLFHAVIVLTRQRTKTLRRALIISYALTVLFNVLNLSTNLFTTATVCRDAYAYPKPSLVFPLYFVLFVLLVVWSTLLLVKHADNIAPPERNKFRLFLAAHTLAYLGGLDNFLIMFDVRLPMLYPYGLYPIPFYALVAGYAVPRWLKAST